MKYHRSGYRGAQQRITDVKVGFLTKYERDRDKSMRASAAKQDKSSTAFDAGTIGE
jgi:hypothetical protein